MPRPAPKPLNSPRPKTPSRFEQFMRRNIVVIAICTPLAVIALVEFIVSHI